MNAILITILVLLGLLLAVQVLFFLKVGQIWLAFNLFMRSGDESKPSQFGQLCQDLAKMTGESIAMSVKATAMGKLSGDARLEQAIQGDMLQDQMQAQNPALGFIMDSFPSLKKRAMKNPGVVEYLLSRLGNTGVGSNSGSSGEGYGSRLAKYR